jgi:hypothetical protein
MKDSDSKRKIKNRMLLFVAIVLALGVIAVFIFIQTGTYDLKGKWSLIVEGTDQGENPYTLYINAIQSDSDGTTGQFIATGCLTSEGGLVMPFDMQAKEGENGEFTITIVSTARLQSDQPDTIKMTGLLQAPFKRPIFPGRGTGTGRLFSQQMQAGWEAEFQSDETENCDLVNLPEGIYYFVNMSVHYFYEGEELKHSISNYGIETNIAHSAARVETPIGNIVVLDPDTDVFSPRVDFITNFRLEYDHTEQPVVDEPYIFTLYNAINEPIPGTTIHDLWSGCAIEPTRRLNATFVDEDNKNIQVQWDMVPAGRGWDPERGIGFYQLLLVSSATNEMIYGSEMQMNQHIIPWEPFEDGSLGMPDGMDYGLSLSELPDGDYIIWINSQVFSTAGISTDCVVRDEAASIYLVKSDEQIVIVE